MCKKAQRNFHRLVLKYQQVLKAPLGKRHVEITMRFNYNPNIITVLGH